MEAGDYHLAIAVLQPYLSGENLPSVTVTGDESVSEEGSASSPEWQERYGRVFLKLSTKDRAEITRDLGTAFEKTGSPDQALSYLQRAYRLEIDTKLKAQLNKEIQQIRSVQRRRATNQTRRPEIHSALEQEHPVRPRLPEQTMSNQPRPQDQGQKGGGQ